MMNIRSARLYLPLVISALFGQVIAEDLALSDEPLFLKSGVQNNIFFVIDDSGSMDWNALNSAGANDHWNISDSSGTTDSGNRWTLRPSFTSQTQMLTACPGFNVIFYNPDQVYTPWSGEDDDGNVYANQNYKKAQWNPYDNKGGTVDLTDIDGSPAGYFPWNDNDGDGYLDIYSDLSGGTDGKMDVYIDANSNGAYDTSDLTELECPDYDEIKSAITNTTDRETFISNWFIDVTEMDADEQTNYANWFSYYRKREFVAKKAVSSIITNSTARMGLSTLHNNNKVNTEIKNVDDISTPIDSAAQQNKKDLLTNLFEINSNGYTPLRARLKDAGEYYKGNGLTGISNAANPILSEDNGGSCQQNFTILMTDGVWNQSSPNLGTNKNADSDNNSNFDGAVGGLNAAGTLNRYADAKSNVGNTLADVAMHYYETDLDTTLENTVPTYTGIDENSAQHMVTYTVAFGVKGDLTDDTGPDGDSWAGWPTPQSGKTTTIDDVWHAAVNGRGLFLSASDSEQLIETLNSAISDIQGRSASASAVSVNTGSVSSDTMVFQAEFNSQTWSGKLFGVEVGLDGTIGSASLASIIPAASKRVILTYNDDNDDNKKGVPFQWGKISKSQQSDLSDETILDYLRGDDTLEIAETHRDRLVLTSIDSRAVSPLGDIINSAPVYVGNSNYYYPDNLELGSYQAYKTNPYGDDSTYSDDTYDRVLYRKPMVYVGANDGMLHAFNADAKSADFGVEEFAYVPSSVYPKLKNLSDKAFYHKYTVDGSPTVADVYIGGKWKTILVSGLGAGGQGLFALDISNPDTGFVDESTAASNVLWEFTDKEDSDLGYTLAQPVVGKSHHNGKWVAFVGNGYNNTESDDNVGSGTAKLFVIDIETGAKIAEIDTGKNALSTPNGLSTVNTLDVDGDYIVDYVYGGDLEGNMWRFDVSNTDSTKWSVSTDVNKVATPLFVACATKSIDCPAESRQPITVKPQIALNRGANGYLIFFGTGTYLLDGDNEDHSIQSFYGIWDRMEDYMEASLTRSHLLEQQIIAEVQPVDSNNRYRVTSSYDTQWYLGAGLPTDSNFDGLVDTHLGWYMDFVNTQDANTDGEGERLVSNPQLRDNNIIFTTSVPDLDPCNDGGSGWYMELDALSGSRPLQAAIDLDDDDDVDGYDVITYSYEDDNGITVYVTEYASGSSSDNIITSPVCITLDDNTEVCISNTSGSSGSSSDDLCEAQGLSCQFRDPKSELGRWTWQEL